MASGALGRDKRVAGEQEAIFVVRRAGHIDSWRGDDARLCEARSSDSCNVGGPRCEFRVLLGNVQAALTRAQVASVVPRASDPQRLGEPPGARGEAPQFGESRTGSSARSSTQPASPSGWQLTFKQ